MHQMIKLDFTGGIRGLMVGSRSKDRSAGDIHRIITDNHRIIKSMKKRRLLSITDNPDIISPPLCVKI